MPKPKKRRNLEDIDKCSEILETGLDERCQRCSQQLLCLARPEERKRAFMLARLEKVLAEPDGQSVVVCNKDGSLKAVPAKDMVSREERVEMKQLNEKWWGWFRKDKKTHV